MRFLDVLDVFLFAEDAEEVAEHDAIEAAGDFVFHDVVADDKQISFYKKYWKEKCDKVYGDIDNMKDRIDKENLKRKNWIYLDIYGFIDTFLKNIKDEVHLKIELSDISTDAKNKIVFNKNSNDNIGNFIDTIVNKMKKI